MAFADLKKNKGSNIEKLQSKLAEGTKSYGDENYWKLEVDAAKNGSAVIRFLPAPDGEDFPFVRLYEHSFRENGKWYIEKSRTTLGDGERDPVGVKNYELYNSGSEDDKKLASSRRRQTKYIVNILVIEDKKNPENNGQVFYWKIGKKLFEMIESALKPQFDEMEAIDPFDFWEGANFHLRAYDGANGQRTYEKSAFAKQTELFGGDEAKLKVVYDQIRSLKAEVAPNKFKSYDELQKKFDLVTGAAVATQAQHSNYQPTIESPASTAKAAAAFSTTDDDLAEFADLLAE